MVIGLVWSIDITISVLLYATRIKKISVFLQMIQKRAMCQWRLL